MNRTIWILLFAFFAAGTGIGFVIGSGASGRGGSEDDLLIGGGGPEAKPVPVPVGHEAEAQPGKNSTSIPAEVKPGGVLAGGDISLADALASIPAPEIGKGTGIITGCVKSKEGRPLGGVLVRAIRLGEQEGQRRRRRSGPSEDDDLEKAVRELVSSHRWMRTTRRDAVTNAAGEYELTRIAEAKYFLTAFREGFEISAVACEKAQGAKPGDRIDFIAKKLFDLRITVLLPDGRTPDRAEIRISDDPHSYLLTRPWSRENPVIELNPGTYTLLAISGEDGEFLSDPKKITLEEDRDPGPLTLPLKGISGIRGKVVLPAGQDPDRVWVHVLRISGDREPDLRELVEDGDDRSTDRDDDYAFAFKPLPPGTYFVGVTLNHLKILASQTVSVKDGMTEVCLVMPPPDPRDCLFVRVFGPEGKALGDVEFRTGFRSQSYRSSGGASAVRRKDGSFLVHHQELDHEHEDKARKGRFFIVAESNKYGEKEVEYTRGEIQEITFRFLDAARLEAVVSGYAASTLVGRLSLTLESSDVVEGKERRNYYRSSQYELDSEGRRSFGPLQPGSYDLVLIVKHRERATFDGPWPVNRLPLMLTPGKKTVSIEIPPLYSLTVEMDKSHHGLVELKPQSQNTVQCYRRKRIEKDRNVVFHDLPAGEYKVTAWGGAGSGEMLVTVPGPSLVQFKAKAINAMMVKISNRDGYLTQAGFMNGDLIIGINGEEFRNEIHIQSLFYGSLEKKKINMLVLRGGARIEIPMDPKKIMQPDELGGTFMPASRD